MPMWMTPIKRISKEERMPCFLMSLIENMVVIEIMDIIILTYLSNLVIDISNDIINN